MFARAQSSATGRDLRRADRDLGFAVGMSMLGLTKKLPDAFRRLPGDLRHASARLII
jgi:hypothetical protein